MQTYNYENIKAYWNVVFENAPAFTIDTKLPYPEIMDGIRWLGEQSQNVLDFGCGNGKALIVSSKYGVRSGLGIDLCENGIALAQDAVMGTKLEDAFKFVAGGIETLERIEPESFDGAILFNILDNLHPEDGQRLIEALSRVLKKGAAVLLKLNPVYEEAVFNEDDDFKTVTESCYEEESGLLFWNMDENVINTLLTGKFEYVNGYDIDMKDFETVNRMYWLKKI